MLNFYASEFIDVFESISRITISLELDHGTTPLDPKTYVAGFVRVEEICKVIGLTVSALHASDLAMKALGSEITPAESNELAETIKRELKTKLFLYLPSATSNLYRNPLAGWEIIIDRFKECGDDVEEMYRCFALERYGASVFHALLVVEHGLIALGNAIKVTDPKVGWDATYKRLVVLVADRKQVPPGIGYDLIEQSKARLDSMKLAWRNKVNHAAGRLVIEKSGFNDISAEEVIMACRSFMRYMAEELPSS